MDAFAFRGRFVWPVVAGAVWAAACGSSEHHHGGSDSGGSAGTGVAGTLAAGLGGSAGASAGRGAAGNSASGSGGSSGKSGSSGSGGTSGSSGSSAAGTAGTSSAGGPPSEQGGAAGDDAGGGASVASSTGGMGTAGRGGSTSAGGEGGEAGFGTGPATQPDKVDLLFVVDNSISMYEKQSVLSATLPKFVARLVDPYCTNGSGPATPPVDGKCPDGQHREIIPVTDMHVGVITTSLGDHGSNDVCSDAQAAQNQSGGGQPSNYNDHARLLPSVRTGLPSWNGSGFLNWDADGKATPPGESDVNQLVADLHDVIAGAGSHGCGYESTLEAGYRFLADPEPPLVIANNAQDTTVSSDPTNIDQTLLDQRAAFLRPDSVVVIVSLSDENDCSIDDDDGTQGWLVGYKGGVSMLSWHMPRATSECATNPNDSCCRPCGSEPTGCPPSTGDTACMVSQNLTTSDDSMNLRCYRQRQRFGIDLLYPLDRYLNAFTGGEVYDHHGQGHPNPLFAGGRNSRLVVYAPIVGVPWQDVAQAPNDTTNLDVLSSHDLRTSGRWSVLVGDYRNYVDPSDPFMIESIDPRTGSNPITGAPIVGDDSTNPAATINGHEQAPQAVRDDLQYACTFPLPAPIVCDGTNPDGCDCDTDELAYNRPQCQPPGGGAAGNTEYLGVAYPGIRHLELARELGDRAVISSICSRNTTNPDADDYGYLPAMRAIQTRLTALLGPL